MQKKKARMITRSTHVAPVHVTRGHVTYSSKKPARTFQLNKDYLDKLLSHISSLASVYGNTHSVSREETSRDP